MRATNACVERLLLAGCELLALAGVGVQPAVEGVRAGLAVERVVAAEAEQAVAAAVQTAINNWSASGGCATPEAQINALWNLAQPGAGVFRAPGASKRIIPWFGDLWPRPNGGHAIDDAIAALQAANAS
jgi:hypothetical protein